MKCTYCWCDKFPTNYLHTHSVEYYVEVATSRGPPAPTHRADPQIHLFIVHVRRYQRMCGVFVCVCSILWQKALRFYSKCFHPINMCKIWPSKYGWNAQRMHKAETSQNKTKNSKQQHCCCQRCWRLTFIATTLLPYELIISISESRWDQFLHINYSAIFAVRMAYLVGTFSAKNCLEMVAIRKMSVDLGQPKSLPKWISEREAVLWMHDSDRSGRTKPVPIFNIIRALFYFFRPFRMRKTVVISLVTVWRLMRAMHFLESHTRSTHTLSVCYAAGMRSKFWQAKREPGVCVGGWVGVAKRICGERTRLTASNIQDGNTILSDSTYTSKRYILLQYYMNIVCGIYIRCWHTVWKHAL